jgi:hypothetical protein
MDRERKKRTDKISDSVVGQNAVIGEKKREEHKKMVWGLATGQLENAKVKTQGTGEKGSFGGDEDNWGSKVSTGHTFYNPATEAPAAAEAPKWDEVTEDVMEDKTYVDRQATKNKRPSPDISGMLQFGLGKSDGGVESFTNSMNPQQKQEWGQFVNAIKDPAILEQIGGFDFATGTDATPMSKESRARFEGAITEGSPNYNQKMVDWATSQGLNTADGLDDKEMQHLMGWERVDEGMNVVGKSLEGTGIDINKVFNPYTINNHTLGQKMRNQDERFFKATSRSKAKEIEVAGEPIDVPRTVKEKVGTKTYRVNKQTGEKVEVDKFGNPVRR